jgi:hypothetical protein
LTEEDFQFNTAPIFARLGLDAESEGGFLSDVAQNRQFSQLTQGLSGANTTAHRQTSNAASQAGLNPFFAQQQNTQRSFDTMQQLVGQRAGIADQQANRQYEFRTNFANMLAGTATAEKEFRANTIASIHGAERAASAQESAGRDSLIGSVIGGGLSLLGGVFG